MKGSQRFTGKLDAAKMLHGAQLGALIGIALLLSLYFGS
jgi:hypothetical protein